MRKVIVLALVSCMTMGSIALVGCGTKTSDTADHQGATDPSKIRYIETHVHLSAGNEPGYEAAADAAIASMDELGIMKCLLLPPPLTSEDQQLNNYKVLAEVVKKNPERFDFLGGGGTLNPMIQEAVLSGEVTEATRTEFKEKVEEIVRSGAVGFGEMAIDHFSFNENHPYMAAPADHPLFLLLADLAAEHNIPIDIHMEAVPNDNFPFPYDEHSSTSTHNPEYLNGNIDAFERLRRFFS